MLNVSFATAILDLISTPIILYTVKIVYCQGDVFRPLLGHLQALWEDISMIYLNINALFDSKRLQIVLYECEIKSVSIWDPTMH